MAYLMHLHLRIIMLGKNSTDNILKYFILFFPESKIWCFMQSVFLGNNLHEMSNPIFWKKKEKNISNLLSAEFAHYMLMSTHGEI